ncbi:MAG: protein phosphatase 2C domain-containing protein [Candidatus Hydrogenedentes bacterium]|nr:protein phosphatase 2C domain-containing protein [Candidatus Hydrogenedentota bacterium]
MRIDIAAQSDTGRRKKDNEDSFGVFREDTPDLRLFRNGALLIVADGLGGHMGGEIASKLAVSMMKDVMKESLPPSREDGDQDAANLALMCRYVEKANASVFQTNQDLNPNGKPMGTTLATGLITPRKVHICNVGDSRVYHIRDGEIIGQTEDHSWVDEQVKLGLMSKAEAEVDYRKNVVTRSIGTRAEVTVDTYTWHIVPGDWVMLCSDGLVNMVKDADICEEFRKGGNAAEITARLINQANENGGKDNVTVIAANISPSLFHLLYFALRALKRKHGFMLLWFVISLILGLAGFVAGYLYRDGGNLLPIF